MAINKAMQAFTNQQNTAASEYKDAWSAAPAAGLGQFGGSTSGAVPFGGSPGALTSAVEGLKPMQNPASTVAQTKPMETFQNKPMQMAIAPAPASNLAGAIDALPTTPTGVTSGAAIQDPLATTSNYSSESPYVSGVTDGGAVGRQAERPMRLAIDDTMSSDEQYRRAWQNESNGFFGNEAEVTAKPEVIDNGKAPMEVKPAAPIEYGVSYQGQTDSSDGEATVYDKATGKVVKQFPGMDLHQRMGGVGAINSDQLKQYTGWSAPVADNTGAGA